MRQKKNGLENLVLITQLGLNVVTPVFLCVAFGSWLDKKTGLHTVLVLLILGVLAGGLSAYKMAKRIIEREREIMEKEKEEQVKRWDKRFGDETSVNAKSRRKEQQKG